MAVPKVFISSTCFDFAQIRTELGIFISNYGFDPILSEDSDILFDHRSHTQTSCIQEIVFADMVILIIGGRFGGTAIPKAIDLVNFDILKTSSSSIEALNEKNKLSITQLEVLKAIESGIPVFAFIASEVLSDHKTYEHNKGKAILDSITFPNIDKQETAKYIFEFINFLRLRNIGNSIVQFSKLDDIKTHLRKQWAALLQRLLYEQRIKKKEEQHIDYLSSQITDLKTAIFSTINSVELKETARGAIKFRILIEFITELNIIKIDIRDLLLNNKPWDQLLNVLGIVKIINNDEDFLAPTKLVLKDNCYFSLRFNGPDINELRQLWSEFILLSNTSKSAIYNAVLDDLDTKEKSILSKGITRYSNMKYSDDFTEEHIIPFSDKDSLGAC